MGTYLEIPYDYVQEPACGHAMTVTHTVDPSFSGPCITHDTTNKKFTSNSFTDLAIGATFSVDVTIDVGG